MKIIAIILLFISPLAYADTASDIEKAVKENIKHTQNEDVDAVMKSLHSQSPSYLPSQQMIQQLFPAYDLKYELLSFQFVGEDGEYAYARIKQSTKKVSGPAFQNNIIDALMVFKKRKRSLEVLGTSQSFNFLYQLDWKLRKSRCFFSFFQFQLS